MKKDQPLAKRSLDAHSIIGIIASAAIFIVCLSGTVSVFKEELKWWEQGSLPPVEYLHPNAAQTAAEAVFAADPTTKHLYLHIPTEQHPRLIAQTDTREIYANADGQLMEDHDAPWTDFIIDLHYYLNLPQSFGMQVVALLGVVLFTLSITGLFAHPNIFKDAFRVRFRRSPQIGLVDLHNRLSVWTAPFHLTNSITGSMIGFALLSSLVVGTLKYEGDFEAVFEPVFGEEPAEDLTSAPMANISAALSFMEREYPQHRPIFVILHEPGTAGQYLQIMAEHSDRLIYAEKYNFTGDGQFIDTVGSADGTVGQQVADSVYKIHFGNFGGLGIKLAYGLFGICLLVLIGAGMELYVVRRSARGQNMSLFKYMWRGIQWGTPLLLLVTLATAKLHVSLPLAQIFWTGLLLLEVGIIVAAFIRKSAATILENRAEHSDKLEL